MESIPEFKNVIEHTPHRALAEIDIQTIFEYKSFWSLFYATIIITGMRPVDLAMLRHWSLDRQRDVVRYYREGSNGYWEVSVPPKFLALFPDDRKDEAAVFPVLFSDIDDPEFRAEELNENLGAAADYLAGILSAAGRPIASLMALKRTHDEVREGENDIFYETLIAHIDDLSGVFDMPEA